MKMRKFLQTPRHGHNIVIGVAVATCLAWLVTPAFANSRNGRADATWTNTAGGNWNVATNWDVGDVPDVLGESAVVPADGFTYTITLDIDPTIDYYQCYNPNATLALSNRTLTFGVAGSWNEGVMLASSGHAYIHGSFTNANSGAVNIQYGDHLHLTGPSITNDGTILVNTSSSTGTNSYLHFDSNVSLNGMGELRLNNAGPEAQVFTATGMTLTNGSSHSITGMGEVHGAVTNEGTISADVSGSPLDLLTNNKVNNGTISAVSGGYLDILSCQIDQGPSGVIIGDASQVRLQGNTNIVGGNFDSTNGGFVLIDSGTNTIQDITNLGDLHLDHGTTTVAIGSNLTNEGQILINTDSGTSSNCYLRFDDDILIDGYGDILLNNAGEEAQIQSNTDVTVTHGANHLIHGMGEVHAAMINEGEINADVSSRAVILLTNDKVNNNTLLATNNGYLEIDGVTVTQGINGLTKGDGGTVRLQNGATIIGGTLDSDNAGVILTDVGTVYLEDVTNLGTFDLDPGTITVVTGSEFTNDGSVLINTNNSTSTDCYIRFDSDILIDGFGDILLNNAGEEAQIQSSEGFVVTHGADHVIHGIGEVRAAMINYGLINADVAGGPLDLMTYDKHNHGTLLATNNAYLDIVGVTVTQESDALIMADGGTVRFQGGPTIIGGLLDTDNGGLVLHDSESLTLEDITNLGDFHLDPGAYTYVNGGMLTNDGMILVNTSQSTSTDCPVTFNEDCTLQGTGEVVLNNTGEESRILAADGYVLNHAAGHTIRGKGQIRNAMDNYGTINADANGSLTIMPTELNPFVNYGEMLVTSTGGLIIFNQWFTNAGNVTINETCELTANDGYVQNDGTTTVNGILDVNGDPLTLEGGVLNGTGTVEGEVENAGGTVSPGLSAGTLTISGDYEQQDCSTLHIEIGGYVANDDYDVLAVTENVTLGGTLTLELINGFIPQIGDSFQILTGGSVSGYFGNSCPNFPALPEGHFFVNHSAPDAISVVVLAEGPCVGDLNWDHEVNINDIFAILGMWGPCGCECCPGDLTGDDVTDINDIFTILGLWGPCE